MLKIWSKILIVTATLYVMLPIDNEVAAVMRYISSRSDSFGLGGPPMSNYRQEKRYAYPYPMRVISD